MTDHHLSATCNTLHLNGFSATLKPALVVKSGDRVHVEAVSGSLLMQMTKHPRVCAACREICEELGALLSAEMKCPPHEVGQALANPSP